MRTITTLSWINIPGGGGLLSPGEIMPDDVEKKFGDDGIASLLMRGAISIDIVGEEEPRKTSVRFHDEIIEEASAGDPEGNSEPVETISQDIDGTEGIVKAEQPARPKARRKKT